MSILWYTFIGLAIMLHFIAAVKINGSCLTPLHSPGYCVKLEECSYLYYVARTPKLNQNTLNYLRKSLCGHRDKKIWICCPEHYFDVPNKNTSLLLTYQQCGKPLLSTRINNGRETAIDEFPWTVLIEYTHSRGFKGHLCGGTLINNRYVITAAHCLQVGGTWRLSGVRLGEWDKRTNPDCNSDGCAPRHQDIAIAQSIAHPGHVEANGPNDIALLRLAETVELNDFVQPICLPTPTNLRSATFDNLAMDVAGWGKTERGHLSNVKLKASVTVTDLAGCARKYFQYFQKKRIRLYPSQLCAGGELGTDTCDGDSGGPLMFVDRLNGMAVYYLAGVVSFGPRPCGIEGWPGVYTRVGAFIDWIENQMQP